MLIQLDLDDVRNIIRQELQRRLPGRTITNCRFIEVYSDGSGKGDVLGLSHVEIESEPRPPQPPPNDPELHELHGVWRPKP